MAMRIKPSSQELTISQGAFEKRITQFLHLPSNKREASVVNFLGRIRKDDKPAALNLLRKVVKDYEAVIKVVQRQIGGEQ